MLHQPVNEERVRPAFEAANIKQESIRSAAAEFGINPTSTANKVGGRVALVATFGSTTVLTADEETAIEDLLVYTGRYCLDITLCKPMQ